MRCSTGTAWSSTASDGVTGRQGHRFQKNGYHPNDLWCADYKGEFMLADRRYCYPLTITDFASRYLIACEALSTTREAYAFTVFESVFKEFGLPSAIRTDNGVPFASPNALFNLSKLSVWWLRLGIDIERIRPGCPQQNGRHERMHLTLTKETTKPAGANFLQQQARFDDFIDEFNSERPHQALGMNCPAEHYQPSTRPYAGLPDLDYPFHNKAVTACRFTRASPPRVLTPQNPITKSTLPTPERSVKSRSACFLALLVSMLLIGGCSYENHFRLHAPVPVEHRLRSNARRARDREPHGHRRQLATL